MNWLTGRRIVKYFDQRLGVAHSKRWSKETFSAFLTHFFGNKTAGRNIQQRMPNHSRFKFNDPWPGKTKII